MHTRLVGYCVTGFAVLALALGGTVSAADKKPRAAKGAKTVGNGAARAAPEGEGTDAPGEPATASAPAPEPAAMSRVSEEPPMSSPGANEGGAFTFEVMHPMLKTISGQRTAVATGKLPVIEIDKTGTFVLEAGRLDLRNEVGKVYLTAWVTIYGRVDGKTGRVLSMKMDANCNAGRIGGAYEAYQLFADPNMEVGTTKAAAGSAAKFVLRGKFNGPIGHSWTVFKDGSRMEGRKREDGRIEGQFETQIRGKMLARLFPPKPRGPRPVPAWALPACIALGVVTLGAALGVRIRRRRDEPVRPASEDEVAFDAVNFGAEPVQWGQLGLPVLAVPWPRRRRRRRRIRFA